MKGKSKGAAKPNGANPVFLGIASSTVVILIAGLIRIVALQWHLDHNPSMIVDPDGFVGVFILCFGILILPVAAVISGIAGSVIQKNAKQSPKEVRKSALIAGAITGAGLSIFVFYMIFPM